MLDALDGLLVELAELLGAQPPDEDEPRSRLDERIDTERKECDRTGYHRRADRYDALDDVPVNGQIFKPETTSRESLPDKGRHASPTSRRRGSWGRDCA